MDYSYQCCLFYKLKQCTLLLYLHLESSIKKIMVQLYLFSEEMTMIQLCMILSKWSNACVNYAHPAPM